MTRSRRPAHDARPRSEARSKAPLEVPVVAAPIQCVAVPVGAEVDPNHHLWKNGRLWWIAFTVHRGHLQERVRFSLGTADVERARAKRDRVFELYAAAEKCHVSIRLRPRRRASGDPAAGGREVA